MVDVKLLSYTTNIVDIIYTACRTCYSKKKPTELFESNVSIEKKIELIKKVISSGHFSVLRHINFVFGISNTSRSTSHQLVRHQKMNFSQQSQRYCNNIPLNVFKSDEWNRCDLSGSFDFCIKHIEDLYNKALSLGMNCEDARDILPNATYTNLVTSLDLNELIHLSNVRLCNKAQPEIRKIVRLMVNEVLNLENMEFMKEYLVPKCTTQLFCNEFQQCEEFKNIIPNKDFVINLIKDN